MDNAPAVAARHGAGRPPISIWFLVETVVVLLVVAAVFRPNITAFFHSDDLDFLYFVKTSGPLGIWVHTPTDYFRPLVSIDMWAEWHLWGFHPAGYHASHLFLHSVNVLLVYFLARGFALPARTAVIAAALFLVLPGHSEAVAWVSDRSAMFVTVSGLACVLAYLKGREFQRPGLLAATVALFTIALLSKEASVTLPVVLLIVEYYHVRVRRPEKAGCRLPFWLLGLLPLYFLARHAYVGSFLGGPGGQPNLSPLVMAAGIVRALPATISPTSSSVASFAVTACLSLGVVAVLWLRSAPAVRREALFFLVLFFAAGLPSFWTSFSPPVWGYDTRILYLASAFVCMGLSTLLAPLRFSGAWVRALFLLYAFQSWQIFGRWHDAGEWVKNGIDDLGRLPYARRLIILDNPDMRYPGYVFRRGLTSGLMLQSGRNEPTATYAPCEVEFYSDRDFVTVVPAPAPAAHGYFVTIHYAEPPIRRTAVWNADGLAAPTPLLSQFPPSYEFRLPSPEPGDRIVFFSRGHFRPWNRATEPRAVIRRSSHAVVLMRKRG